MSLPEIREPNASPAVAAIYRGLREGVGVGQVNLIWRHAAALPGVLDWLWAQAGPALTSGAAAGARDRIAAAVAVPDIAPLAAPPEVAALVETYNRGNLTNLALLTAIRLRAQGVAGAAAVASATVGAALPEPPPLPRLAALPEDQVSIVRSLAARHGLSDPSVIPSLYLHLAHWPEILAAMPAVLAPLFAGGAYGAARDATVAAAEAQAPLLMSALGETPSVPAGMAGFLATLAVFTREVIPGMVPVGLALRAALRGG